MIFYNKKSFLPARIIIVFLCYYVSTSSFAQVRNYQDWEINSSYLTSGKLVLKPGEVKTIKFNVKVWRFLASGSSSNWEPVNFIFQIRRFPAGTNDWWNNSYPISVQGQVVSADFQANGNLATKEFTLTVQAATDPSSTSEVLLQNNDKILLFVKDSNYPFGWSPAEKSFVVNLNSTPPPPVNIPIAASNLTAEVLTDNTVLLKWSDNSNNEDHFRIRREKHSDGSHDRTFWASANATEIIDNQSLILNSAYRYSIQAATKDNQGSFTGDVLVTLGCPSIVSTDKIKGGFAKKIQAANYILGSNNSITSGDITFAAGDYIKLSPPFSIKAGVNFIAKIESCPNSSGSRVMLSEEAFPTIVNDLTSNEGLLISPNPSNGVFNLEFKNSIPLFIKVSDLSGRSIFLAGNLSENSFRLNLSTYKGGVYFIKFSFKNRTITKRIILNK